MDVVVLHGCCGSFLQSVWSLGYPGDKLEYPLKVLVQDHNHDYWVPRVGDSLESNNS